MFSSKGELSKLGLWVHRLILFLLLSTYICCFAVDVGSSGVCMFHVLILMSILVLNCEVL